MTRRPADDSHDPDATTGEAGTTPTRAGLGSLPLALKVGLAAVFLEAVAFVVLAAAELGALSPERLVMGISTAVFFLGYGVLLALCARGMARRSTWGRSIVVMGQLIQLGVAWSYRSGTPLLSAVLAVVAVVVLVGLLHPASIAALDDED